MGFGIFECLRLGSGFKYVFFEGVFCEIWSNGVYRTCSFGS